ncbi:MAG: N-acetylneuraminate synthase [Candidatus Saganbacteria bacterium]|nr:N-acetylneuraminate synthase [Candidatus Saganbacteria bacterium]
MSFAEKIFIIAEAGVNHNGSVELAMQMVDRAASCGVDAIKFQTFKAEKATSRFAPKASYQKIATDKYESQLDMLKKLELDENAHCQLMDHCQKRGIVFLSSPFDLDSIELLNRLGVEIFKIPSGEITDLPYLKKIGSLKRKIILSTGMASLDEIQKAIDVLVAAGTEKENMVVLHCNVAYPTPMKDVNLLAMSTMQKELGVAVGYSDHTLGIEVSIAAAALGADIIEKHFTLDKNMSGPDHQASLDPIELENMVAAIRNIEKALGDGAKKVSPSELVNLAAGRKSIVALDKIIKGDSFSDKNITVKRPGNGISPMKWDAIIGSRAKRNFEPDELIEL